MAFTSLFMPTGESTAISTSGTTQEIDPAGALIVNLTSTTGSDAATLPAPVKFSSKVKDSNDQFIEPKVCVGQMLKLVLVVDGGSLDITTTDADGDALTLTFADANDEILLVATSSGYAVLNNSGVALS